MRNSSEATENSKDREGRRLWGPEVVPASRWDSPQHIPVPAVPLTGGPRVVVQGRCSLVAYGAGLPKAAPSFTVQPLMHRAFSTQALPEPKADVPFETACSVWQLRGCPTALPLPSNANCTLSLAMKWGPTPTTWAVSGFHLVRSTAWTVGGCPARHGGLKKPLCSDKQARPSAHTWS